jgi:hypothetical protein
VISLTELQFISSSSQYKVFEGDDNVE